jgi:hypothetical protein
MTSFQKLFINPQNLSEDFIKKICFLNNVRSKYFTVLLIICSSAFTFYDISIIQKLADYKVFLIHFKADIIFLVFSFVFTLYIFFNQVKTHRNIQSHHKYVHGIISIFILLWSVFKSVIFIKYGNGNYNIAVITIITTSFLYLFPLMVYFSQLLFTFVFAIIISLLYNFTIGEIINDIFFILIILFISMIISRYVFYLQLKILFKESEVMKYRGRIKSSKGE